HVYGQLIHIQWLAYEKSVRDLGKENMDTIVEINLDTDHSGHDCTQERPSSSRKVGITTGLDIYAGTLTRNYFHNRKTIVPLWDENNGYTFNRITPDGEPADDGEELSPAEVQAPVENWRDQILAAIAQPGQEPYAPWPQDNEKPYYTGKPDWDAF